MNGESAVSRADVPSESTGSAGTAYYIQVPGSAAGPLSLPQLREWLDAGEVTPDTLCWTKQDPDCFPRSDILDLLPCPQPDKVGFTTEPPRISTSRGLSVGDWQVALCEGLWLGLTCFAALMSLVIPLRTGGLSLSYEAAYLTVPLYPVPLLASLLWDWLAIALAWVQFPLYVMILGLGGRRWGPLRTLAGLIVLHFAAIVSILAWLTVRGWLYSFLGWGG